MITGGDLQGAVNVGTRDCNFAGEGISACVMNGPSPLEGMPWRGPQGAGECDRRTCTHRLPMMGRGQGVEAIACGPSEME